MMMDVNRNENDPASCFETDRCLGDKFLLWSLDKKKHVKDKDCLHEKGVFQFSNIVTDIWHA